MVLRIKLISFVILVSTLCTTEAIIQQIIGTYLQTLGQNLKLLEKEKGNDNMKDYDTYDDYYYKDDYKPKPKASGPPPKAGGPPPKGRKAAERARAESEAKGRPSRVDDSEFVSRSKPLIQAKPPPSPKPAAEKPSGKKANDGLNVLTVKKFLFQAKPVTPFGDEKEATKIYYYL